MKSSPMSSNLFLLHTRYYTQCNFRHSKHSLGYHIAGGLLRHDYVRVEYDFPKKGMFLVSVD